jgi:TRAP transporter TAXI family solute receptor
MAKKGIGIISVFFLLLFLGQAHEAEGKMVRLKWGSTSVRSGFYPHTVVPVGVINKTYPKEIQITVVETGGYVENLARLQKRTILLGPAEVGAGYASYKGIMDFKGRRHNPNLRCLWGGYVTPIHIITSKKSGATTMDGLNGLRFAMNPGTTSGRLIEFFLEANQIKPAYKLMGLGASLDAMKAGTVQGWSKAGFKDAMILDIESTMDINIIPIREEMIDKMNQKYPGHGKSVMIPAGVFKAVRKDQLSFADVISDFVDKSVPNDIVYKIVKAVWENRATIADALPTLKQGKFEDMFGNAIKYDLKVPFHPGAIKFYEEVLKVKVPKHLKP